jgi:hypothetical protein
VTGAVCGLITRKGNDFSAQFPFIASAVNNLPARSCLIDGEAIVTDDAGLAVFVGAPRSLAMAICCCGSPMNEPWSRSPAHDRGGTDVSRGMISRDHVALAWIL